MSKRQGYTDNAIGLKMLRDGISAEIALHPTKSRPSLMTHGRAVLAKLWDRHEDEFLDYIVANMLNRAVEDYEAQSGRGGIDGTMKPAAEPPPATAAAPDPSAASAPKPQPMSPERRAELNAERDKRDRAALSAYAKARIILKPDITNDEGHNAGRILTKHSIKGSRKTLKATSGDKITQSGLIAFGD